MTVYKILGKKNIKMLLEIYLASTKPHPSVLVRWFTTISKLALNWINISTVDFITFHKQTTKNFLPHLL